MKLPTGITVVLVLGFVGTLGQTVVGPEGRLGGWGGFGDCGADKFVCGGHVRFEVRKNNMTTR